MDGGFAAHPAIEQVEAAGVQVLAPVPRPKDETRDRYLPRPSDSATIAAWRQRMGTAAAQATYRSLGFEEMHFLLMAKTL